MSALWVRDEYRARFGRQELTLWSGPFADQYEADALELPNHDGYMIHAVTGGKVRVSCESPRTEANYERVDDALTTALRDHATQAAEIVAIVNRWGRGR